jgi:hypothetical protein
MLLPQYLPGKSEESHNVRIHGYGIKVQTNLNINLWKQNYNVL